MYICVEKNKTENNALYYLKDLGRRRIYRQSFPLKPFIFNGKDINKNLKLFTYKNKKKAQELCDYANKIFGSNYVVEGAK